MFGNPEKAIQDSLAEISKKTPETNKVSKKDNEISTINEEEVDPTVAEDIEDIANQLNDAELPIKQTTIIEKGNVADSSEQSIKKNLDQVQKTEIQNDHPELNETTIKLIIDSMSNHQEQLLENEDARKAATEEIIAVIKEKSQDYEKIEDMKDQLTQIANFSIEKAA